MSKPRIKIINHFSGRDSTSHPYKVAKVFLDPRWKQWRFECKNPYHLSQGFPSEREATEAARGNGYYVER